MIIPGCQVTCLGLGESNSNESRGSGLSGKGGYRDGYREGRAIWMQGVRQAAWCNEDRRCLWRAYYLLWRRGPVRRRSGRDAGDAGNEEAGEKESKEKSREEARKEGGQKSKEETGEEKDRQEKIRKKTGKKEGRKEENGKEEKTVNFWSSEKPPDKHAPGVFLSGSNLDSPIGWMICERIIRVLSAVISS